MDTKTWDVGRWQLNTLLPGASPRTLPFEAAFLGKLDTHSVMQLFSVLAT